MQWETTRDDSLTLRLARGVMHSIYIVSHLESKITILEKC